MLNTLPFGTTDITGGTAQQSEFIVRSQLTSAGGFTLVSGLVLVLIGVVLRQSGGKP